MSAQIGLPGSRVAMSMGGTASLAGPAKLAGSASCAGASASSAGAMLGMKFPGHHMRVRCLRMCLLHVRMLSVCSVALGISMKCGCRGLLDAERMV